MARSPASTGRPRSGAGHRTTTSVGPIASATTSNLGGLPRLSRRLVSSGADTPLQEPSQLSGMRQIAPARQASIYVDSTIQVAEELKLRPADTGANVVLVEPFDSVVFERTMVGSETGTTKASGYGIGGPDGSGVGTGSYGQGFVDGSGTGTGTVPNLRLVAPTQLAADLLTGPGREPSEGNELLAWMSANEDAWRV